MNYLKNELYYNDLYDRFTVEECRSMEKRCKKQSKSFQTKDGKIINKFAQQKAHEIVNNVTMYNIKGGRYANKAETISQWMQRDQDRDNKLINANEPDVLCVKCNSDMECISKDLHNIGNQDKVLFFFTCPSCKSHRAFFDNGEEYKPSHRLCPQCQIKLTVKDSRKGKIINSIYSCTNCNYKKKEIFNLNVKSSEKKSDSNFEKDKAKFCLSKNEGEKYILQSTSLSSFMERIKDEEENKEVYEKVTKINKLTIHGVQELLDPILEKQGYVKFEFAKPRIEKQIIADFTVQDTKNENNEYDSRIKLGKLLNKSLDNTNWKLMSTGINYRLGILSGSLKGFEFKDDLVKLVKVRDKKRVPHHSLK